MPHPPGLLAPTPPMGWNSWNRFGCDNDEKTVRATADAMVSSGMRDAGYKYLVIDDCWQGNRDANGFIQPDPAKFPSGIKALADYVHDKGLKFGIYSDAGEFTCGHRPGSQGHEYQDALQYAFRDLIEAAVEAGWSEQEAVDAVGELVEGHIQDLMARADSAALMALLKTMR